MLELRPNSTEFVAKFPLFGFLLPSELIKPIAKETLAGITAAIHGIELPRQSSTTSSTQKTFKTQKINPFTSTQESFRSQKITIISYPTHSSSSTTINNNKKLLMSQHMDSSTYISLSVYIHISLLFIKLYELSCIFMDFKS